MRSENVAKADIFRLPCFEYSSYYIQLLAYCDETLTLCRLYTFPFPKVTCCIRRQSTKSNKPVRCQSKIFNSVKCQLDSNIFLCMVHILDY